MLPATITTAELCAASGYSKPALHDLETSGIIRRQAKDTWPMPSTLAKIVTHLRDKVRRGPKSEAEQELYRSRAALNAQRLEREAGDLVPTWAVENCVRDTFGAVRVEHCALPARVSFDLARRGCKPRWTPWTPGWPTAWRPPPRRCGRRHSKPGSER